MQETPLFYSSLVFAAVVFAFSLSEIYTFSNHVRKTVRNGSSAALAKELASWMNTDRGNSIFTLLILWLSVSISWIAYGAVPRYLFFPGPAYAYVLAGAVAVSIGIAIRRWSMASLGKMFTHFLTIQSNHRIVTKGPYRIVRHPSYLGGLLTTIGFGVVMGNLTGLLICVVLPLFAYALRISKEEDMLSRHFKQEYKKYTFSVRYRIVPYVW